MKLLVSNTIHAYVSIFTATLFISSGTSSCKKQVPLPDSKIAYKVDGETFEHISQNDVYFFFGGLMTQTVGKEKPSDVLFIRSPKLSIKLQDPVVVAPGFYNGKSYQNGKLRESELAFIHNADSSYGSPWSELDRISSVEIIKISREYVQGKFSGIVVKGNHQREISEGTFEIYNYRYD